MPKEKALDLRNLTQQYRPQFLGKRPYECLKKKLWTFEISPSNIGPNCKGNGPMNALRKSFGPSKSLQAISAPIGREMSL